MRRVRELRWTWIATLLLLALCGNAAAAVRASVDHDRVAVGEPVVLNIASDRDGEPDFAPLASDFELQGRSVSSQTSIVNGSAASQRTWAITLAPRRSGALRIPALDVGGERTDPIALTVTEQPAPSARDGAPVFIENTLETDSPYVQQTVVYTLRLYYAVTLLDGQLDAPSPPDAQLHQVGNDVQGSTTLGGRRYNLIERQYLLTPERSGTLQLPAPTFRGRAMGEGFDGMFDGGTIGARGQPKTLEVRPRPAQAAEPWLPAQAITLSVDPPSGALHAGEPFTLTVKLSGEGVTAAQLPDPQLSQIAGAQVYPEASTTQDSVRDGHLLAARTRRFAIVPNVAGVLLMPPIQQSWWDVRKDGAAVASVGVPTLEVLPGTVSTGSSSNGVMDAAPTIGDGASIATASSALRAWQFAAAIFALGWIATLAWGVDVASRRRSNPMDRIVQAMLDQDCCGVDRP